MSKATWQSCGDAETVKKIRSQLAASPRSKEARGPRELKSKNIFLVSMADRLHILPIALAGCLRIILTKFLGYSSISNFCNLNHTLKHPCLKSADVSSFQMVHFIPSLTAIPQFTSQVPSAGSYSRHLGRTW